MSVGGDHADSTLFNVTERRLVSSMEVRPGDQVKELAPERREALAATNFKQSMQCIDDHRLVLMNRVFDLLRGDPLQAFSIWSACKVRWHTQLGVPPEQVRKILQSKMQLPGLPGDAEGQEPSPSSQRTSLMPLEGMQATTSRRLQHKSSYKSKRSPTGASYTHPLSAAKMKVIEERDMASDWAPQTPPLLLELGETGGNCQPPRHPTSSTCRIIGQRQRHWRQFLDRWLQKPPNPP